MGSITSVPVQIGTITQTGVAAANSVFGPATAFNNQSATQIQTQIAPVVASFDFF